MTLFSMGSLVYCGYLLFVTILTISSAQEPNGYIVDIRGYKVSRNSQTEQSVICTNISTCHQSRADEFCQSLGNTKYYISCPKIGYIKALQTCDKLGGQLLRNHTNLPMTLSKFNHYIFYKCKKFWIYCKECVTPVTKPSKVNEIIQSVTMKHEYTTTITSRHIKRTSKAPIIQVSSTHESKTSGFIMKIMLGVVVAVTVVAVSVLIFCILMTRKKLLGKTQFNWCCMGQKERGDKEQNTALLKIKVPDVEDRHKTFKEYPVKDSMFIQNLALMGFTYKGLKDRVQCVYCGVCLEDWDTKDDIFEEHHKNAPECSLMLRFLQHQSSFTDNSVL